MSITSSVKLGLYRCAISAYALFLLVIAPSLAAAPPNVIFVLTDDQGYGDVSSLNPGCKVGTPNIDRLKDSFAVAILNGWTTPGNKQYNDGGERWPQLFWMSAD